jgi:hypothetical protein
MVILGNLNSRPSIQQAASGRLETSHVSLGRNVLAYQPGADGTAWMAFYSANLLSMALELARDNPGYQDIAFRLFGHLIDIADAINELDGAGLWDEEEFLSPYGIRSLSRYHRDHPYEFHLEGEVHRGAYAPGESDNALFGGNSNWRGPVWFSINYLLTEALETYGIIVSNHGGRQLDVGQSTIRSLAKLVAQFKGQATIMMDSGIRTGPDIAASLATGAEFTFLGRGHWRGRWHSESRSYSQCDFPDHIPTDW